MSCPFCRSQCVSCPTDRRGAMEIKSGPATCLNCGAREIKTGPGDKLYLWVKPTPPED